MRSCRNPRKRSNPAGTAPERPSLPQPHEIQEVLLPVHFVQRGNNGALLVQIPALDTLGQLRAPKPQHPAVIPRIQGHSNARIRLESGLHETLPQEGSCAHRGIPAPGAAQIPLQAGQGFQPGEPGMSLLSPPCSRRSRWAQPLSSQQGDLPGSGM